MTQPDLIPDLVRDVLELEHACVAYREMLSVALQQLADANTRYAALQRSQDALRTELRQYVQMRVGPV